MGRYKTEKTLPERAAFDFYPTARETVLDALHIVCRGGFGSRSPGFVPQTVLEPGAGLAIWGRVLRERLPLAHLTGVELQDFPADPAYNVWLTGRFQDIAARLSPNFGLVMGNPPFDQAEEFVRLGLGLIARGGRLIYLLKLSFEASQGRGWGLFQEFPPRWKLPCSKRPSFTGDGGTADEEYAFYVWEQGFQGKTETLWLPKAEVAATWKRKGAGRPRVYPNRAEKERALRARRKVYHEP